jgi:hypothetical protein
MSGIASLKEKDFLRPGAKCIIQITGSDLLKSYWWGTVRNQLAEDLGLLFVDAEITGGRVTNKRTWLDERKGEIPTGDYTVLIDTDSTCSILYCLICAEEKLQKAEAEAERHLALVKNVWEQIKSVPK